MTVTAVPSRLSARTESNLSSCLMLKQAWNNIQRLNKRANAIVALRPFDVLQKEYDSALQNQLPLAGRIFAVKDNFATTDGTPTACASKALESYQSPFESTVVGLLRQGGATIVGKTNMDEFAMGSNNTFSIYGKTINPIFENDSHSTGGSSGGSAAAVAAGMCDVALGTDTGGSTRLPAAWCSVVGFKPSYGTISRYGVVAYAQSFDTVGIVSKNVALSKETFALINVPDPKDPTCQKEKLSEPSEYPRKLRIGVIVESIIDIDPLVREEWIDTLEALLSQGHELETVSAASIKHALPTYFTLTPSEAQSNLARYDGIRYGFRADEDSSEGPDSVLFAPTKSQGFGEEVQKRLLLGAFSLTAGAYDSHYAKAQRVRRKIQKEFEAIFDRVDVVIQPTARTPAPTHTQIENSKGSLDDYVNDVLTSPANVAGLPAISVPTKAKSIGMQIIGRFNDDYTVLHCAQIMEDMRKKA